MVPEEALKKLQEQIAAWPMTQRFVAQQLIEDYRRNREDLRAYKDTGLTPEQCENAKAIIEAAFSDDTSKAERIRELLKADKDGRVVVLPVKPVFTPILLYIIEDKNIYEDVLYEAVVGMSGNGEMNVVYTTLSGQIIFEQSDIGKTVFFTREEAKKALEAMKND